MIARQHAVKGAPLTVKRFGLNACECLASEFRIRYLPRPFFPLTQTGMRHRLRSEDHFGGHGDEMGWCAQ
jgi:hypothetical protein